MQFSYLSREQKVKQAGEKTALFHAGIRHNCEVAWCAEKIASWDTIRTSSGKTCYEKGVFMLRFIYLTLLHITYPENRIY